MTKNIFKVAFKNSSYKSTLHKLDYPMCMGTGKDQSWCNNHCNQPPLPDNCRNLGPSPDCHCKIYTKNDNYKCSGKELDYPAKDDLPRAKKFLYY